MLLISIWQMYKKRRYLIIDSILFSLLGLAGILVGLLWFATDHIATKENFNIIWLFPGHILVPLILFRINLSKWINIYFILALVSNIAMIIFWSVIPQQLHIAFVPIMGVIIIRSLVILIQNKNRYVAGKEQ